MKKLRIKANQFLFFGLWVLVLSSLSSSSFAVEVSIRELVDISSLRDNQISGYGLIVGLEGTGDSRNYLSKRTLQNILSQRQIEPNLSERNLNSKNLASVFVTASLPAGISVGDRIDVWVSSVGDAKSIAGGYLLQTPLVGADGVIYAVAQVKVPDISKSGNRNSQIEKRNTILIPRGAILERVVEQNFTSTSEDKEGNKTTLFNLTLRNFDLSNAIKIVKTLNQNFENAALLSNGGKITVTVPQEKSLEFISKILETKVDIIQPNKIVIDSSSGTIVMGGAVSISKVSVTKGGITIEVENQKENQNSIYNLNSDNSKEQPAKSIVLDDAPTVEDLVSGLNKLGLSAKDIIDILRAIDSAGALHGILEIL